MPGETKDEQTQATFPIEGAMCAYWLASNGTSP
jgi:hypothetical protein